MLCYHDKTFCPAYLECIDGDSCPRALTPEVKEQAEKANLLICSFLDKPGCFIRKLDNEASDESL